MDLEKYYKMMAKMVNEACEIDWATVFRGILINVLIVLFGACVLHEWRYDYDIIETIGLDMLVMIYGVARIATIVGDVVKQKSEKKQIEKLMTIAQLMIGVDE